MPACQLAVIAAMSSGKTSLIELLTTMNVSATDTEVGERQKAKLKELRRKVLIGDITWKEYSKTYDPEVKAAMKEKGDQEVIFAHGHSELEAGEITYNKLMYLLPSNVGRQVLGVIARMGKSTDDSDSYVETWATVQLMCTNQHSVARAAADQKDEGVVFEFYNLAGAAGAILDELEKLRLEVVA
jgi:Na+-translocating ferredoxin:NAD+ oxidoreductase RnfG subunit